MEETIFTADNLEMKDYERKLPTGLNVLTILSIIGCVISLVGSVYGFISAKTSYLNKDKTIEQLNSAKMPGWAKGMMPDMNHFDELVTKSYENRIPILILSLIAIALCFVGVLQMRKLKKQGYLLYVIGELLPFVSMAFFIGFFSLSGFAFIFSIVIALLFIFLYTTQRKHLVY